MSIFACLQLENEEVESEDEDLVLEKDQGAGACLKVYIERSVGLV